MVDSHLGETGVRVIVITVLEQERETELDLVPTQHLLVMGGEHINLCFCFMAERWLSFSEIKVSSIFSCI